MKALFLFPAALFVAIQVGCASHKGLALSPQGSSDTQLTPQMIQAPEVAVMPVKEGVLIAWKPIHEADGYFVYRETPTSKSLLGIGPKDAQGFIDRHPTDDEAKYSVQAFKVSEISDKQETKSAPDTIQRSESIKPEKPVAKEMPVTFAM